MRTHRYLDSNSTVPFTEFKALEHRLQGLSNASSLHHHGRLTKNLLESVREQIAADFSADPFDLFFTSGATESLNLVFRAFAEKFLEQKKPVLFRHLSTDHSAVIGPMKNFKEVAGRVTGGGGIRVEELAVDSLGLLKDSSPLVAGSLGVITVANNETGVIQDLNIFDRMGCEYFVMDITQCLGKMDLKPWIERAPKDKTVWIFSAHKLGALAGIGVSLIPVRFPQSSVVFGGKQERSRRPGTENLAGITSLGIQWERLKDISEKYTQVKKIRDALEKNLRDLFPSTIFHGRGDGTSVNRLPNTSNFHIPGFKSTILMYLDQAGFSVSLGSACSSGMISTSHVIMALTAGNTDISEASVRVSLLPNETEEFIKPFCQTIAGFLN